MLLFALCKNAGLRTPGEKERRVGDKEGRGEEVELRGEGESARVASGDSW